MKEHVEVNLMLTYTARGHEGFAGNDEGGDELRVLTGVELLRSSDDVEGRSV